MMKKAQKRIMCFKEESNKSRSIEVEANLAYSAIPFSLSGNKLESIYLSIITTIIKPSLSAKVKAFF